jgi:His/Glu/Gln/Arg/opine family amino acid ABC transporter permease subunit
MSTAEITRDLLDGAITTIEIAAGAWAVSATVGLLLAVVHDAGVRAVRVGTTLLIAVLRSTPQLILLYLVFFGLPSAGIDVGGLTTAIVVLGLADAAFNAEYYRASLVTVPPTQRDAGMSLGFSRLGTLTFVVLPQAMLYMVAPLLNSFLSLLKTATLASAIGVPEILYRAQNDMQLTGQVVAVIAVVIVIYAAACMPLIRLISRFERRTRERLYT